MSNRVENFEKMIEKSKQLSKDRFIRFAKDIYDVDEDFLEHLWNVPIISSYQDDTIISTTLSTRSEDDILDILDSCIEEQLGDSLAVFIPFEKLAIEFESEEIQEYLNKLNNKEIRQKYNAFIVYNEAKIKREIIELQEANSKKVTPVTKEELDNICVEYLTKIFTHERCHLNANYLVCDSKNPDLDEHINGAEMPQPLEYTEEALDNMHRWQNWNEVCIDTLSQMINNYEEGENVQDCLYKIIKTRNGKSQYDEYDDKVVLAMFTIFPEELTEWTMFGAYDQVRINLLEKRINQVFGEDEDFSNKVINEKIKTYCSSLEEETLSSKQIEMLEMLGVSNIEKKITKESLERVAISETAMANLEPGLTGIKTAIKDLTKEEKDVEVR